MAVAAYGRVLYFATAGDNIAGELKVSAFWIAGEIANVGAFLVKDGSGNSVWSGETSDKAPNAGIEFPGGLAINGIEFDTLPTNAAGYAYLL